MKQIDEYIKLPQSERQKHINLEEPCLERGGQSMYLKGLLAHIHDTTIPSGKKIHVCHACNNAKCSNPNHLYWGTASENAKDREMQYGTTIWDKMVAKYGLEEAKKIQSRTSNTSKAGKGNTGKPKSVEHRLKIAESIRRKHAEKTKVNGDMVELVDTLGLGPSGASHGGSSPSIPTKK